MSSTSGTVFIALEPSIAELRLERGRLTGVELLPDAQSVIDVLNEHRRTTVLLAPADSDPSDLAVIRRALPALAVVAGGLDRALAEPYTAGRTVKEGSAVFVSADRGLRAKMHRQVGIATVPHPRAAEWVLDGEPLLFAKVLAPQRPRASQAEVLPYSVEQTAGGWLMLALATYRGLAALGRAGASFDVLPFSYQTADCALVRLDVRREAPQTPWPDTRVLAWMPDGLVLALEGDGVPNLSAAAHAHGALEVLLPAPELLARAEDPDSFTQRGRNAGAVLAERSPDLLDVSAAGVPSETWSAVLPDAATFSADCQRYSGAAPIGSGGTIVSRHIRHPDNHRTVNELVAEMTALGYCTYTHDFVHNGQTLSNVIADMPGRGYFRIKAEILKKLVLVLRKYPHPHPWPEVERALVQELGRRTVAQLTAAVGGPFRRRLDEIAGVYRWMPWWRLEGHLVGIGAQLVIVGCHLDSSADRTPGGYDPVTDAAPGMDDNASGIAACLATARYLSAFRGQLIHTVRFGFFNAEEAGLVGSKAYAAYLKSLGAPVKAALCADMIGYNSDLNRLFEIHAGYTDPIVRDRSLPVAAAVEASAASLGALPPAQIYRGTSASVGAPDRDLYDPGINRSDHAAFHQQGYAAVVVTEDFFANLPGEPGRDANPGYHTAGDTTVDADFGAAITGAIACAAKDLAAI